jgi:hypothetical protein
MLINLTFHFNHGGSILFFLVVQTCINTWHSPSHIFHYFNLLNVVDSPHSFSFVRAIQIQVIPLTSPKLYMRMLPWHFPKRICCLLFILGLLDFLVCWRVILEKGWLKTFLPLLPLSFHLVIPSLLKY